MRRFQALRRAGFFFAAALRGLAGVFLRAAGAFKPQDMAGQQSAWTEIAPRDREQRRRRVNGPSMGPVTPTATPAAATPATRPSGGISSHARRQQRNSEKGNE